MFNFTTEDNIPHFVLYNDPFSAKKAPQKMSSIVGKMQKLYLGAEYKVQATCEYNAKFSSYQYKPTSIVAIAPKTFEAQSLFLKSLASESIATNILNEHPNVVEQVMNGELVDLEYDKIKGLGRSTWKKIRSGIIDNYVISDIIVMLQPLGVTYNMIKKLLSDEPNPVLLKAQLEKNPYIMTKIRGLGFKRVDDLSLKLKPELKVSMHRLTAFVDYHLREIGENSGHTWVEDNILQSCVSDNVPECMELMPQLLRSNSFLYQKNGRIGLNRYHDIEEKIFAILVEKTAFQNDKFNFTAEEVEKSIRDVEEEQGFDYTEGQRETIIATMKNDVSIISGKAGCVDCETEFFTGTGWKKISEYNSGDSVLQFSLDNTVQLVKPIYYIKEPCEELYLLQNNTKSVNQCVCENHSLVFQSSKGHIVKKHFKEFVKQHYSTELGYQGKILTTFRYSGKGLNLTEIEIRIMVATIADGTKNRNGTHSIRVKKIRKKERMQMLLKESKVKYTCRDSGDFTVFTFLPPLYSKEFDEVWFSCSQDQLKVVTDELQYWDARYQKDKKHQKSISVYTSKKSDADFIQFAFSAIGKRATISKYDRVGHGYFTSMAFYDRKSIEYTVNISHNPLISLRARRKENFNEIKKVKSKDGYKYCFTVPSGMLVLRRDGKINITGNCGKTTIAKAIFRIYRDKNFSVSACALSAKAAQRISEATGYVASTIHRTLGAQGLNEFMYNHDNPLRTDVVFLDEASMVNAKLFYDLLCSIGIGTRLIISGDHRQLPPIGYGNIFSDILGRPDMFNSMQLTKPMRQAEMSGILSDANLICDGVNPIQSLDLKIVHGELNDMYYMFRDNREALRNIAVNTYIKSIETDGIDEVVIATPRKDESVNSAFEINKIIQDKLLGEEKQCIDKGYIKFKLGAKVIQTVNDYEKNVFNGEVGYITSISEKYQGNKKSEFCMVTFKNLDGTDKLVEYTKGELDQVNLAYALTVHKLQGSGYKTVIGIIDNTCYTLLDNCMLYTMITRAKKRCLLLAEPTAFLKCIRTNHNKRQTWIPNLTNEGACTISNT